MAVSDQLSGLYDNFRKTVARSRAPRLVGAILGHSALRRRPVHYNPPEVPFGYADGLLNATLWQHPVGQGFFHSGTIQLSGRRPFRYVYDCGKLSGPTWPSVLGPALTRYQRRPIDALFVSHFDRDHVNGLSPLLEAFGGASRAFLPYLDPIRRLMIAAREAERGRPLDDEYIRFLDNPGDWLASRGVTEVIYVTGGGGDGGPDTPNVPELPPDTREDGKELRDATLQFKSESSPPTWLTIAERDLGLPSFIRGRDTPKFMDHREPVLLHADTEIGWVFQTYVDPDEEMSISIASAIKSAFGSREYSALTAGKAPCAAILRDKARLAALSRAYRVATMSRHPIWIDSLFTARRARNADRSRMNRTSMSLYSGPFSRQGPWARRRWCHQAFHGDACTPSPWIVTLPQDGRTGWLLTGDAVLGDKDVLQRFLSFFDDDKTNWLAQVEVLTIPHHGSEANFSDDLLQRIGVPPVAVIPAGAKTHYSHPSDEVLEAIREHGVVPAHVHAGLSDGLFHSLAVG